MKVLLNSMENLCCINRSFKIACKPGNNIAIHSESDEDLNNNNLDLYSIINVKMHLEHECQTIEGVWSICVGAKVSRGSKVCLLSC